MTLLEEYGNIFADKYRDLPKAHCISGDLKMGAGIAVQFDREYHIKEKLKQYWDMSCPMKAPACFRVGMIYNLVTKDHFYDKPTLESMSSAIYDWRHLLIQNRVKHIVIPEIGCGLDKLEWSDVKNLLIQAFLGVDITITVVHYVSVKDDPILKSHNANDAVTYFPEHQYTITPKGDVSTNDQS